jgi:phosphotransacetylase
VDKYVEALLEARKGKNLTRDSAMDAVTGDVNMFGVMMVAMGDAGGMVSGSIHTTAATIRPAMQVLKTPNLVSSIFFMCLPDKVCGSFARKGAVCTQLTASMKELFVSAP